MLEPMEYRQPNDPMLLLCWWWGHGQRFKNPLVYSLVRAVLIKERDILTDHPPSVTFTEEQDMV